MRSPSTSWSNACPAAPARARTAGASCSEETTRGGAGAEPAPQRSSNAESVVPTQSPLEQRVARLEQVAELQRALASLSG